MTPLERAGTWSFSKVGGAWGGYVGLRNARAENERMRSELDQLRLRNRELESQAAETQRLSTVLNFRNAHAEASMLAAQVIGSSADPTSHTLFINRGEHDRLRINMGVVTPDGIVGKIVEVKISGLLAKVVLAIGDQQITSIITADAVREMQLRKGQTAAALMKSTEVMIVRV